MNAQDNTVALEEAVLGSVMNDHSILALCPLVPNDFLVSTHRAAWEAMQRMASSGSALDALSVAEHLDTRRAPAPERGWMLYLGSLSRETAAPKNAPSYAAALRGKSMLRQAQVIGREIGALQNVDVLDSKIRALIELTQGSTDHSCDLQTAMREAIDLMDGSAAAISTGLRDLDDCIGGLYDGDLVVIGARPSMGKTACMLNLALASRVPVGVISGEQGRRQIGMRMIAINGGVSMHRMRKGALHDSEWPRVTTAINASREKSIWIYDKPGPSIDDVVRQARAWKYDKHIGVLMIDYLQKLRGGEGKDFRLQIGDIICRLKDLARELKIPVVVLAQVKREVESRPLGADGLGRMPYMGDIAESGIIEQEADVIITLYRPEVYADEPRFRGIAYANVCKQREGPVGHRTIAWRGEYLQFADLAHTEEPHGYGDSWSSAR